MVRTPRIPKGEIAGLYGYALKRFSRKLLGDVPEPAEVMWHNRAVLTSVSGFGRKAQKWDRLDANLKSFASMAVAARSAVRGALTSATSSPTTRDSMRPRRAVFVLREVFDTPSEEIAEAVGKSSAAVRQIAHRARDHVAARRPRMPVSTAEQQEAVDRFLVAIRDGDLQGLLDVLAPDVVVVSDGGGLVAAARRPIRGAELVAGFLISVARIAGFEAKAVWLNGSPGGRIDIDGEVNMRLSVENGRITHIYAIRNPHKLAGLEGVAVLTRA